MDWKAANLPAGDAGKTATALGVGAASAEIGVGTTRSGAAGVAGGGTWRRRCAERLLEQIRQPPAGEMDFRSAPSEPTIPIRKAVGHGALARSRRRPPLFRDRALAAPARSAAGACAACASGRISFAQASGYFSSATSCRQLPLASALPRRARARASSSAASIFARRSSFGIVGGSSRQVREDRVAIPETVQFRMLGGVRRRCAVQFEVERVAAFVRENFARLDRD